MRKLNFSVSALVLALATMPVQSLANAALAASAPSDSGLQDIIVTAQKRPEVGQKVPLAVTSLNADAINAAHITAATDLQRVIPNLTAEAGGGATDPAGSQTLFTIRGLGGSPTGPQGTPGVAVHLDGVYLNRGIGGSEFYDLERIEVDPGPQGTLYGRSAAAGAVNIIPAKPTPRFEVAGTAGYGNYNAYTFQGMINFPVSDKLAVRASFQTQNHDGYYSNGYDALNAKSARVQALFTPTDKFSIRLYGSYTGLRGVGTGNVFVAGPTLPLLAKYLPQLNNADPRQASVADYCIISGQIINTSACQQSISYDHYAAHAELIYDFGAAKLTVIPAYEERSDNDFNSNVTTPLSSLDLSPSNTHQSSIEARLSDAGHGKLKWVVGASYLDNVNSGLAYERLDLLLGPKAIPGIGTIQVSDQNYATQLQNSEEQTYAVFGQATYPILPSIRLTLGLRYDHDKDTSNEVLTNISNAIYAVNGQGPLNGRILQNLLPGGAIATPPQLGSVSFNGVTYRAAIDADVGPRSIVYASVGSGFKPGGLNDGGTPASSSASPYAALAPNQTFAPEKVTHFELGTKNRFLGNTLQINNTIYYDDYSGYQNGQTQFVNPLQYQTLGFIITNAGKAEVYGDELSVKWQATKHDIFDISANYLHAKFTTYVVPQYLSLAGLSPQVDYSGYSLPNAPEFSGNVSYQHIFELQKSGTLVASVFSHITKGYWVYFAQSPGTFQSSYTNTTLDLTWTSADKHFKVSAFVNNLENNVIKTSGAFAAGYTQVSLAPPRTYGGTVSIKF